MKDKSKLNTLLIFYLNGIIIAPIYYFLFKDILLEVAIGLSVFIGIILPTFGWFLFYLNTYFAINHHHKKPSIFMVILGSFIYLIPAAIISYSYVTKKLSNTIANLNNKKPSYRNQRYVKEIRCPNCNALITQGNNFCIHCGSTYVMEKNNQIIANLSQKSGQFNNQNSVNGIKCPKCNNFNIANGDFCVTCGFKLK